MTPGVAAIVPAAGQSRRMGRPKLLLPLGGRSVIRGVVAALVQGGCNPVCLVAPPADQPGAVEIAEEGRAAGAWVIACPAPTPDMRGTICVGLDGLAAGPGRPSGVLIAPGDCAALTAALVAQVIARFAEGPSRIVVPVYRGRRGHPLALPWELAVAIPGLPPGTGVKALLERESGRVARLEVEEPGALADLDTPEDYRRLSRG